MTFIVCICVCVCVHTRLQNEHDDMMMGLGAKMIKINPHHYNDYCSYTIVYYRCASIYNVNNFSGFSFCNVAYVARADNDCDESQGVPSSIVYA